jgi:hypothetical protein
MSLSNFDFFISLIHEFIVLQSTLQDEFIKRYPSIKDHKYLLDFPRQGNINALGTTWSYSKHGVGIMFKNSGIVVDIHNHPMEKK